MGTRRRRTGWWLSGLVLLAVGLLLWGLSQRNDEVPASSTRPRTSGGELRGDASIPASGSEVGDGRATRNAGADTSALLAGAALDAGLPAAGSAAKDAKLDEWLRRNAREAEEHVETFCAESQALVDAGVLAARPGSRDAAAYLGVRVDWQDGRLGLLHPAQPLVARLDALPGDAWVQLPEDAWAGLDFSWLTQLLAFDAWSLSADGSLRNHDQVGLTDGALPDFDSLAVWAKLRLARGLRRGELSSASTEVRHLARLLAATGTWWGGIGAEELLRLDLVAWQTSGLAQPEGVVSLAQRERFRRVANAAPLFFLPGVSARARARALGCASAVRCASLAESLWLQSATRELLHDETSWLLAQPGCDRGLFERIQRAPPLPPEEAARVFGDNFGIGLSLRTTPP